MCREKRELLLEKTSNAYICITFTVFLFFTGFEGYRAIFDAKSAVFTVTGVVYIVVCAALCFPDIKLKLGHPIQKFALLYLLFSAISALLSKHFPKTLLGVSRFEGLFTIAVYVSVFLLISQFASVERWFFTLLSSTMILMSAVVILQRLGINVLYLYPKGTDYYIALEKYSGAFISTVGNADISSAFFTLITPILSVVCICEKRLRVLHITAFLLSFLSLILTSVSAGAVALVCSTCILFGVISRNRKLYFCIFLGLLLLFLLVVYFVKTDGMLGELHSIMHGKLDGDFGSGRIHIWKEVISKVKNRFWFGTGPDTMLYEQIEPFKKELDNGRIITINIDIAHNDYLNIMFHQGIFAVLSYIVMLVCFFVQWFKNGTKDRYILALGYGVMAYCIHIFFSYSACSSAVFFWIILGLAVNRLTDKN